MLAKTGRRGITPEAARTIVRSSGTVIGALAVERGDADAMLCGLDGRFLRHLNYVEMIIGKAEGKDYNLPVLADAQFAALMCGAHPYKIVQSHWHASATETLMEKMGIDWQAKKAEFEAYLKEVEAGRQENLYDPRLMITSGPGYKKLPSIGQQS